MRAGLATPATLYTNDPCAVREFLRRHGGRIIYKPFRGVSWRNEETCFMPYTSLLTEEDLVADDLLRTVPGIYQELVPKACELRVTVIGNHVLGARILSQETVTGRLDWRKSYHELRMEPCEIAPDLAARCRAVLQALDLVFGCFDFIVRPDGEPVFLEVNEMGQFLFVEHYAAGVPLLDAFTELLAQGRKDFAWSRETPRIRYQEVRPEVEEMRRHHAHFHVQPPDRSVWEGRAGGQRADSRRRIARA
jgi:glutathione synthase/RimK-type ligase-like ATP-grasp enzyme